MTSFPTDPADWDVEKERLGLAGDLAGARAEPGAPRGEDPDVLAMSLPPYFSACPNPYLREWLASGEPVEEVERSDPGPFTTDIAEGKSDPMYKAHGYPTKVPPAAIMRFILHYTEPGDVVLDGFCGSGMTGVAAQSCGAPTRAQRQELGQEMGDVRWGRRRAVLIDLSPSATFIAAGLNLPVDHRAFDRRSKEILDQFDAEWGWMYETTDERGRSHRIDYTVWSEVFTCPACAGAVVFYEAAFNPRTGKVADVFRCPSPSCGKELTKDTAERRLVPVRTAAGDTIERVEMRPVAIHYRVGTAKKSKPLDDADLAVLRRIGSAPLPGSVPTDLLPLENMYHGSRLGPKGFTRVHHLFTDRSLTPISTQEIDRNLEGVGSVRQARSGASCVPTRGWRCQRGVRLGGAPVSRPGAPGGR